MDFEWNEAKNRSNIRKHGLDFADAEEMFRGFLLVRPDTREDYGEERWIGIGMIQGRVESGKNTKRRSRTDWKRVDALRDEDIDYSDIPKQVADFFAHAIIWPGPKKQITLRVDPDVLTFFRKQGRGYQTVINAVLRKYMEARKEHAG